MPHPVSWFQISGGDAVALRAFYDKVFGWKMSPSPDGSMHMIAAEKGGIPGGLAGSPDGKPNVSVYVTVDDLAAQLKKVQDEGGSITMPPMELPAGMGWIGGFIDPGGNFMGLWQEGKAAARKPAEQIRKAAKKAAPKKSPPKKSPPKKSPPKKSPPKKSPPKKKGGRR